MKLLLYSFAVVGFLFQQPVKYIAYDNEALAVNDSADRFTASKIRNDANPTLSAELVVFTVNCASGTTCVLRFTVDGTTPTTSVGMRALYGDTVSIYGFENISNFRALRETSTDLILDSSFWRAIR